MAAGLAAKARKTPWDATLSSDDGPDLAARFLDWYILRGHVGLHVSTPAGMRRGLQKLRKLRSYSTLACSSSSSSSCGSQGIMLVGAVLPLRNADSCISGSWRTQSDCSCQATVKCRYGHAAHTDQALVALAAMLCCRVRAPPRGGQTQCSEKCTACSKLCSGGAAFCVEQKALAIPPATARPAGVQCVLQCVQAVPGHVQAAGRRHPAQGA